MSEIRIIDIKESIFENNDREADRIRAELKESKTFLLKLMSSPGAGKTSLLKQILPKLKESWEWTFPFLL